MKKKLLITFSLLVVTALTVYMLYEFDIIPHKTYTNEDFGIETYISSTDKDGDGIDDQTDILKNVREYIATTPKYKSKYYAGGYPDDEYGVCTDVVAFGLKGAGYDIMMLLNKHVKDKPDLYDIDIVDRNIDFRRVRNLKVYFDNNAISLTTDAQKIEEWQGGDIVVFKEHIGIVSDMRNRNGISLVLHNGSPLQKSYEQDILEGRDDIVGHYRIS